MNASAKPKYRILVVDDDLDVNTTFALLIEFDGHEVQTVTNGEAALALLAKRQFDLLITEYWLPHMKGDELAALVKGQQPDLPIIMVTANLEEFNTDHHPISGVDCLLEKPFSMDHLREAMQWALEPNEERHADGLETHWTHSGRAEPLDILQKTIKDNHVQ
jgi:CheY-like chemotaxis protein